MKMVSTTGMELSGFTVSMLCMCESEPTQTPWQSTRISQKGSIQSGVVLKDYHKPDFRANNQGKHYYKYSIYIKFIEYFIWLLFLLSSKIMDNLCSLFYYSIKIVNG